MDKIYTMKNLEMAWWKVRANRGSGGIDGVDIEEFEMSLKDNLKRLHEELKMNTYQPQPVRQQKIPKPGLPGEFRNLGIPTIYDRVCQQAILNRIEPIFEPVFDDANFGYRRNRSAKDALRKVWNEIEQGNEWIVDADLRDFFGSVSHEKLLALVNQRISDGRVLRLLESILKAGCLAEGKQIPTETGTPQGGVVSPCLSNVLLTPFDCEMRRRGYNLTRYADDWVGTCRSHAEAKALLTTAKRILEKLGVTLHPTKTRIVNVRHGFEFLGYKIKRGNRPMKLSPEKIRSRAKAGALYAYPRTKSIKKFKDEIRVRTRRRASVTTEQLIEQINPVIRGWGNYFCKAHVRKIFHQLDAWIVRRIWSHCYKRWRCCGWKTLPSARLYGDLGLVNLVELIPSIGPYENRASMKAGCGKTARPV
ncbi:MAG TPA: group II intron reverse transcriptase/maturase [Nostoc sp.]|uniref:group II intron reverse transcriptase/maturase n=1 Tax=Nostoc sp. TaxID=1180 RepID=UPI002D6438D0|nr:group II intron reverse transcriptase/maturase [Nostoc sp.]HYX18556.1 group II intron reverse transcriptase/maturase [Nostoc sp.]